MLNKISDNKVLLILVLLSIPSFFVLLKKGFYEPHDLHHIADIYEMFRGFESGQLPPRLGPDFSYGYGYPLFNFYYVFPFYLGALLFFLFGSLTISFKLIMILGILVSVVGMYLLLREYVGKFPALVGSILYLYTPYRAVQIYVRGALGEVLVVALLPFLALGFLKVIRKPKTKNIAFAVIITTIVILSHNYLSFISIFIVLLLIAPRLIKSKNVKQSLFSILIVLFFSMCISSFWWAPALIEKNLVGLVTPFPLVDHFPFIKQLILPSWGYGSSVWGPGDEISFQIGLVNLFVALSLFVYVLFFRNKSRKIKPEIFIALTLLVVLFSFMNIRTLPLWRLIPFYNLIQFPWRLLMFMTFATSIIAAFLIESVGKKYQGILGGFIIIASIALTIGYFKPSKIVETHDNHYLNRFFIDRTISGKSDEISKEYGNYSEDYLLLPKWVEQRPDFKPEQKIEISEGSIFNLTEITAIHWEADVETTSDATVTFHSYYFPGWIAEIDGEKREINIGKPYGQMQIRVSPGIHKVEFYWDETPLRKTFDILSLGALGIIVTFLLIDKRIFSK